MAQAPPEELNVTQGRGQRLENLTPSDIRGIHNLGERLRGEHPEHEFIALHFGEGDQGTPEFIVEAGVQALRDGAVNYENNSGRPDLIQALVEHYQARLGLALQPGQFLVTCGGMQAVLSTMLGLLAPGDEVINITPAWPNFREAAVIAGGKVHDLALGFDADAGSFRLELEQLENLAQQLERLRLIVVSSPGNPTGYVMTAEEKQQLLAFCRRRGVTLLADEMYDRIVYSEAAQPSFLQLKEADDRLVLVNGFSKAYGMTGWRLGYLITDLELAGQLSQMQEFVTSCAPAMAQVAAITALREGETYIAESRTRYRHLRDLVLERLSAIPGVTVSRPDGAFYVFFRAPGSQHSINFCREFLTESGVYLAPGKAFGGGGEGWLRLCFAKEAALLHEALTRLERFLAGRSG